MRGGASTGAEAEEGKRRALAGLHARLLRRWARRKSGVIEGSLSGHFQTVGFVISIFRSSVIAAGQVGSMLRPANGLFFHYEILKWG